MKYLVYISSATQLPNQSELLDILAVSRENNKHNNLTGMLLYGEGSFMQLLEGDADELHKTFKAIEADIRHKNVMIMTEGDIENRIFPDWSMGFKSVNTQEMKQLSAYVNPKELGLIDAERSNAMINMLKNFSDTNRM